MPLKRHYMGPSFMPHGSLAMERRARNWMVFRRAILVTTYSSRGLSLFEWPRVSWIDIPRLVEPNVIVWPAFTRLSITWMLVVQLPKIKYFGPRASALGRSSCLFIYEFSKNSIGMQSQQAYIPFLDDPLINCTIATSIKLTY